jgi:hypothetical protein
MALAVLVCLLLLYIWVKTWFYEHAKEITGCEHKRGALVPAVKDRWGRDTALVWCCKDCSFQVPLKMLRAGKDIWIRQEDSDRNRSLRSPRQ